LPADNALLKEARIYAVNDVTNPLWGPEGAAHIYAGQKGASPADIDLLDAGLKHLDRIVSGQLGREASQIPGAGAAGGAAYGMHCFLNARFIGGAEYVLNINGVSQYLSAHTVDYIVTGEGRMDAQTLNGKFIQGVLEMAAPFGVPVLAVCGASDIPSEVLRAASSLTVLEVSDPSKPLAENMANADRLTREAVQRFFEDLATG
jgi:glycerate kinase